MSGKRTPGGAATPMSPPRPHHPQLAAAAGGPTAALLQTGQGSVVRHLA